MKKKILVADDEPDLLELARDILEEANYTVITATDSETTIKKAKESRPDLIILDVRFPTIGGLEVCRLLRSDELTRSIPIIMLTIQSSETDKVIGLEIGADDYITKPFSKKELVARVKAVLRGRDYATKPEKIIKIDDMRIDIEKRTVRIGKKAVSLRPKEFDLLVILVEKRGKVLNRTFLTESVLGYEYFGTSRSIDTHMKNLRKKLETMSKRIETIPGIGYRFTD